jgi:hypothetical protein
MPDPKRREIYLDGHVAIECPLLMSDDELALVLEAFIARVRERSKPEGVVPDQPPARSRKSGSVHRKHR